MLKNIKMKQVSKLSNKKRYKKKKKAKYGTSNLEKKFASEFLDKIGVKYIYQYEAKSIGRFYDFFLPEENLIIEVDGDYFHSFNLKYEQMNPTQKKNKRIDEIKNKWALENGIPILRIWEHDINNNKELVFDLLKNI